MSIILVGYRGSGKTTIGKKLADRLWQTFVDTDDMVAKAAGKTIKQVFEEDGEAKFRELEIAAVRDAVRHSEQVIALVNDLKATEGVEEATVSSEKGEAVIKYDDQKLNEAKLREVINSTGFKAKEEPGQ